MTELKTITLPNVFVAKSHIHGFGVFADVDIKKGDKILPYIGEKVSGDEGDRRSFEEGNEFIMCLDEDYDVDGDNDENTAKYVNHCCKGNVDFQTIKDTIWCTALRDICKGEELTTDYEMDCHELIECHCNHDDCRGYLNHPEDYDELSKEAIRS